MELSDWFKGFEKGSKDLRKELPNLQRSKGSNSFRNAESIVYSAERFWFIKTCMNRQKEIWTISSLRPMNCRV